MKMQMLMVSVMVVSGQFACKTAGPFLLRADDGGGKNSLLPAAGPPLPPVEPLQGLRPLRLH